MKVFGKHLTIDMYGCSFDSLNNLEFVKSAIIAAIKEANMTLLELTYYKSQPQGLTVLALLENSHISIHTYPELGYAALDIFTCSEFARPDKGVKILKLYFKPEKTKITHIRRGDFGSLSDMKPKTKVSMTPLRRVRSTGQKMLHFLSRAK